MNVLDLFAKITLDQSEYDKGLDESEKKATGFSEKLKNGLSVAGKVGVGAAKVAGAAITAASGAAAALMKNSIDSFSDYEQLVGGIETMFEDLSYDVEQNAKNAYKTAGLSANEYMETVMGFSASLNQSLIANEGNIARAADLSDQIITDMADNSNKMGSSMESVQNAYAGFAKQNFTMLDNLKLGYGGTKEEMERLLADAEKLTGKKYDVSNFADIAEAIHEIQTEMGITGTTALEASETISGSLASMKSAWQNLLTGLASGEDLSDLIDNLIDSVETVVDNIMPVAEKALESIGELVETLAPIIAERLPALIETLLPPLLSAATTLVIGIINALPTIIQVLIDQAPVIIGALANAIIATLPALLDAGEKILVAIRDGIGKAIVKLDEKINEVLESIKSAINEKLAEFREKGKEIIWKIADGIKNAIAKIKTAISDVLEKIKNPFSGFDWAGLGINIITGIARGIANAASRIGDALMGAVKGAWDKVTGWLGINSPSKRAEQVIGKNWALGIAKGFEEYLPDLSMVGAVSDTFNGMANASTNQAQAVGGSYVIEIPVILDGREIAKVTAPYTQEVLDRMYRNNSRKLGIVT